MLESLRLRNFKTHRDTEIALKPLTVIVGTNGCGKSSVLHAIEIAGSLLAFSERQSYLQAYATIPAPGSTPEACSLTLRGRSMADKPWEVTLGDPSRVVNRPELAAELAAKFLAIVPSEAAAAVSMMARPTLERTGRGLADVIAQMRLTPGTVFTDLENSLRKVVPQVTGIGVKRVEIPFQRPKAMLTPDEYGNPDAALRYENVKNLGHTLSFAVSGRAEIPAMMMSSGTLLTLTILTAVYSADVRPRILLLDDIDHGLHPTAQWELLGQLRRLLEQFPTLQIVATCHSPDLVDKLQADEVIVMALDEQGNSVARPLAQHPRQDLLGTLGAGQLWSAQGEAWVREPEGGSQ